MSATSRLFLLLTLLGSLLCLDCSGAKFPGGSCPADLDDPSAILEANFGLDAEIEGKVKAALAAGASLTNLAAEVEADVAAACGGLAKDLGASDIEPEDDGPGKKAEAACNAAVKALGELKAKAKGQLRVKVDPPRCSASMNAMADCAAKCDAKVDPGKAKVKCEGGKVSGKCNAKCTGSCTVQAGATCEGSCRGECSGRCEANFSGKCGGTCEGKCDGKNSSGQCNGTCEGKCSADAEGSCGGKCTGSCSASCTMEGKANCEGECSGSCSVEFEEPKCSGEVKPPQMSAECKASCDARVSGTLECVPAKVSVNVAGAADASAASKLRAAIEANLPGIIKVTVGLKAKLQKAVANAKVALEGAQAAVKAGGAAALKVAGCFAASLEAQARASVQIDVSVKASASASASAGAG